MCLFHRYNKESDLLEPSVTVFYKSELNVIGMMIYNVACLVHKKWTSK